MTTPLDDDALQFQKQLGEISVIYPAVKAAIQGVRATSDSDEYDAHMQTYGNLTSQLSIRGESEGAGEDVQ